MHREARDCNGADIDNSRTDDVGPGYAAVLCQVVMPSAKARKVLRHESFFAAERITGGNTVTAFKYLVDAKSGLIRIVPFVSDIGVVIAIDAGAHNRRCSHNRHTATVHAHIQIRPRRVLTEK